MKTKIFASLFLFSILGTNLSAQEIKFSEAYGSTLNVGMGIGGYAGYYGYVGRLIPVLHVNYEFDVARNFTLAPFISFYAYSDRYYWGDNNFPYKYYYYREAVIPVGGKATYYFDGLLKADSKWDFYLAGSLGFSIVIVSWDADYYGDKNHFNHGNPLFLDLHVGTEYHITDNLGAFLDLSTGVSTIGLSFH